MNLRLFPKKNLSVTRTSLEMIAKTMNEEELGSFYDLDAIKVLADFPVVLLVVLLLLIGDIFIIDEPEQNLGIPASACGTKLLG